VSSTKHMIFIFAAHIPCRYLKAPFDKAGVITNGKCAI